MQLYVTSKPMERIAMDILGLLPTTARNNKYIVRDLLENSIGGGGQIGIS
jgi:hypothetical protein